MNPYDGFREGDFVDSYYRRIHEGVQARSWISEPLDLRTIRATLKEESWNPMDFQGMFRYLHSRLPFLPDRERTKVLDLFILAESTLLIRLDIYRRVVLGPTMEGRRKGYRGLIQTLFGIAVLLPQVEVSRRFYLREALEYSYSLEKECVLEAFDVLQRWELLTGTGFLDQAASLFDDPRYEQLLEANEVIYYRAASQFALGNFLDVASTLEQYSRTTALDSRQRIRRFWVGDRRDDYE
ncbi:MAG: hypothetical protein GW949_10600 [Spirochaetales bacterium]|nr:hypothetical protein [Spirochaetales bacterium]